MTALDQIQEACELGQQALMETDYLRAARILGDAESRAWDQRDFDALARLYMPLQEARRQRRQRCGEGEVRLDLWAQSPADRLDGREVVENYPFGQLLVAGWASIEPARQARRLAEEHGLYVEIFLGAVYPTAEGPAIVVVPVEDEALPTARVGSIAELRQVLPASCLVFREDEIPSGSRTGTAQTFSEVMALWERLHTPFLAAADAEGDLVRKIEAYRKTIRVDYACELAHQRLADVARSMARRKRAGR